MNKRGTGVIFCAIAAFLLAAKYISAAIFGSGVASWDADLYSGMLNYVGDTLVVFSVLSLIAGIIYLVWAEVKKEK